MKCPVCKGEYTPRIHNQICCGDNACKSKYNYYRRNDMLWKLDDKANAAVIGKELYEFVTRYPSQWCDVWRRSSSFQAAYLMDGGAVDVLPPQGTGGWIRAERTHSMD